MNGPQIIRVGETPYPYKWDANISPRQVDENNEAYRKWKYEAEEKVGVPHEHLGVMVGGKPPFEFMWIGKSLYKRESSRNYFFFATDICGKDDPHVACECGNRAFTLTYGPYCVDAKCSKCGSEGQVYSG